jgi:deoxynucleotide monophosphate kinase-like protein
VVRGHHARREAGRVILLGLTGYRGSGKTTVAGMLASYGFKTYAFADALREMAYAVNPTITFAGTPHGVLEAWAPGTVMEKRYANAVDALGYERAKEIPDVRRFLQRLGTEGVRVTFGTDAWVHVLQRRIIHEAPHRAVIADVRFASEVEWLREAGGFLWRIARPGVGGNDPHASEAEISSFTVDRVIDATDLAGLEILVRAEADRSGWGVPPK